MTISELLKYLEEVNINTFLREIDEHIQSLLIDFEEGVDTRLLSQIQRLQNLAELLNHKRVNSQLTQTQDTWIGEEKNSTVPIPKRSKVSQTKTGQSKNPMEDMVENYRRDGFHSTITDNKQETGDIHFAASILPYEPRYIRELCRKGIIPHSRPAGKYVFIRSELEDWLKKNSSNDLSKFEIGKMGRKVGLLQ